MALSAFDDKSAEPNATDLQTVLGRSGKLWDQLVAHCEAEFSPLESSWNYSGAKWGWSLRLRMKKRTILYMTPCSRYFLVGMVFGERAVAASQSHPLPESIVAIIDEAPRYAEGRGFRVEIRFKRDLESVRALAAIKMAN